MIDSLTDRAAELRDHPVGRALHGRAHGLSRFGSVGGIDTMQRLPTCRQIMKRTTILWTDEVDLRFRHEAKRRGVTISHVTREAIVGHLGGSGGSCWQPEPGAADRSDVSERIEEILREELG